MEFDLFLNLALQERVNGGLHAAAALPLVTLE
jgi:hypothetical protein